MNQPTLRNYANWQRTAFFIAMLMTVFFFQPARSQYLHTQGKYIVDGTNQEIILRGMGLGGWMLQEGYMLETNSFANPQHQIRAKIEEVIGEANTNEFYNAWLANHCTRRDIDSLASWGFNSIRLPMHYNLYTLPIEKEPVPGQQTWLTKGFAMTDSLLKWCAANEIYLILDLHAAPGGQGNDAAISDYDNTKPSLWQSEANKQKTIALWRKLADRYANEKWIGGYDLINETNWPFTGSNKNGCDETSNAPLKKLFVDITNAIREVDQNHIIFIEGNCWANNHTGLWPAWDNNLVMSFHKYWNYNDQNSVQGFVSMRDQYNVPLWLGESGENSNTWFTNAIQLMESNKIGWAWWPMKKVGSIVNPLTVVKNDGYDQLLNYWKNGGTKPSVSTAKAALMQLAENLKIENNIYRKDVIDAMFRQVNDYTTLPFKNHHLPGVVHASDFDLGRVNRAYFDTDTANYHVSGGTYTAWNNGWAYRNDGVDVQASNDADASSNGYNIGWTADNEWTQYTVNVDSSAAYQLTVRYAANTSATKLKFTIDGTDRTGVVELPSSGGHTVWANKVIDDVILYKGVRQLRMWFEKGGANIGFMKFVLSKKLVDLPLKALSGQTTSSTMVGLVLNKKVNASTVIKTGFSATVNGTGVAVLNVTIDPQNDTRLLISLDKTLFDDDIIKLNYNADDIKATDGTVLQDFTNLSVSNNLPFHIVLPGKVEAEDFVVNHGLQLETTTDTGGGKNIGYTNTGDYLEYRVRVMATGEYGVDVRIACNNQAGKLEVQQLNGEKQVLGSVVVDVPVTGGWQTWKTVSVKMNLTEGRGYLKFKILQPEFNLNWIKFTKGVISGTEKNAQGSLQLFPNPTNKFLNIEFPENFYHKDSTLNIIAITGNLVFAESVSPQRRQEVYVGDLKPGVYRVELKSNGKVWSNRFVVH